MQIIEEIVNQIDKSEKSFFTKEQVIKIVRDLTKEDRTSIKDEDVTIDLSTYSIDVKGKKVTAAKKVIQIAYYLLSNKTKIVTREEMLQNLWGNDVVVGIRTIDVHMRKLRMLIGEDYVTTIKSVGYQWKQ
jgi:two-component system alkaline phosphatase synthesis response regulator PhoP